MAEAREYVRLMGGEGLKRATQVAVLSANYLGVLESDAPQVAASSLQLGALPVATDQRIRAWMASTVFFERAMVLLERAASVYQRLQGCQSTPAPDPAPAPEPRSPRLSAEFTGIAANLAQVATHAVNTTTAIYEARSR